MQKHLSGLSGVRVIYLICEICGLNEHGFALGVLSMRFLGLSFNQAIIEDQLVVFKVDAYLSAFLQAAKQNFIRQRILYFSLNYPRQGSCAVLRVVAFLGQPGSHPIGYGQDNFLDDQLSV